METNGKWIYLFYLEKSLIGCFTSVAHCVVLLRRVRPSDRDSVRVVRVRPNWVVHASDFRYELVTEIIKKAL